MATISPEQCVGTGLQTCPGRLSVISRTDLKAYPCTARCNILLGSPSPGGRESEGGAKLPLTLTLCLSHQGRGEKGKLE